MLFSRKFENLFETEGFQISLLWDQMSKLLLRYLIPQGRIGVLFL